MSKLVQPYLLRATLLAAVVIMFGLVLSAVVYFSSVKVQHNADDLVSQRLPVLTNLNLLINDLTEQERLVYEYYASQNEQQFKQDYLANKQMLAMHMGQLAEHQDFEQYAPNIQQKLHQIEQLISDFNQTIMTPEAIDWDKLREILAQLSSTRRAISPLVNDLSTETELQVRQSYENTLAQTHTMNKLVAIYGFVIVFVGGLVAWYVRQYVINSAKMTRLALFPQHNPHPIISINLNAELLFKNPATDHLMAKFGFSDQQIARLMPNNIKQQLTLLVESNKQTLIVEHQIEHTTLQLTISWLVELNAFDVHIADITDRKKAEQQIQKLAFYHHETHLPNLYKLKDELKLLIASHQSVTLALCEIRDYNQLVTAQGLDVVRELTISLAKVIGQSLPEKSQLYHLHANSFALVFADENQIASAYAQHVIELAEKPIETSCGEFFITVDFGICCFPEQASSQEALFKNAHIALHRAAQDEHQHLVLFEESFADKLQKNVSMLDNLRLAIEKQQLFLVYQPQLNLQQQRVTGIETLVRWRHNDKIVSPAEFIPLAEQSGLIVGIGQWILFQACLFAKQLVDNGFNDIVVAVNVSPRQFSHPSFVKTVELVLTETELAPQHLELEITEGVVMNNEQDNLSVLHQLKQLGLHLSIDDFGTGYSSLSYLKQFPVDKLKIDQSFIRNSHQNDEDKALVKTIIAMGKSLGLSLIAEGVELADHVSYLQRYGCDEIQGYWFSKPLEQEALVAFLKQPNKAMSEET